MGTTMWSRVGSGLGEPCGLRSRLTVVIINPFSLLTRRLVPDASQGLGGARGGGAWAVTLQLTQHPSHCSPA